MAKEFSLVHRESMRVAFKTVKSQAMEHIIGMMAESIRECIKMIKRMVMENCMILKVILLIKGSGEMMR